jgi:hypothetical protein
MILIILALIVAIVCFSYLIYQKVEKYSYVPKVNVLVEEEPEVNMDIVSPIDDPHPYPIIKRIIQTRQHIQA